MSDKLKDLTPIPIDFSNGESPSPDKMDNAFNQLSTAVGIIERAIGDIWNQSQTLGVGLDNDPNYIANLSRAMGNLSKLNPESLGGNTIVDNVQAVPAGIKIFALDYIPTGYVDFSNESGVFDGGAAQDNLPESSLQDVDEAGEYFIDPFGKVYTFSETGSHTATYDYDTIEDSYTNASYNVIPDPAQTIKCSVNGGGTVVTMPVVNAAQFPSSPNRGQQLSLPSVLSYLGGGEEIPAGFIYVWDHDTNKIVEGLTYLKEPGTLASFSISGGTLDNATNTRYSVITIGTQLSPLVNELRDYLLNHNHKDNKSQFLDHADLLGIDNPITHGVTSDIVGKDDVQELTNKTLVDPVVKDVDASPVTDIILRVTDGELELLESGNPSQYRPLHLNSFPATLTGKSADMVDNAHASATPTANYVLILDGSGEVPNAALKTGSGNGLDADTLDSQHAPAGTIVGTSDTQILTNKRLNSPKLNSDTVTTATGDELNTLVGGGETSLHSHATTVFTSIEIFTSSGTFTVPAGITEVSITAIAGGGGGGGGGERESSSTGNGGGGSGGGAGQSYINYPITGLTPLDNITVTIGSGGAGGAKGDSGAGNSGGVGGITVFTGHLTCIGGGAGGWGGSVGAGGAAGDCVGLGGDGGDGGTRVGSTPTAGENHISHTGGSAGLVGITGGRGGGGGGGGASIYGNGGNGTDGVDDGEGSASNGGTGGDYGAGGGGGGGGGGQGSDPGNGGAGISGFLIVKW